ncbi:MAG: hypothetical protein KAR03_12600 [Candidatus Thorarchaeota archaeon]|nr:hypothetical protein [Candidatus Thorarchaeota archaeon]
MIVIASVSFSLYAMLPSVEYEGWLIRQNDEIQYSVTAEINAGDTFVVDILNDYGISAGSSFWIRAVETPTIINITGICENLLKFTGVVQVEQQFGEDWILRNSSLPFFLPTGYWEEIDEKLDQATSINLVREWWGEMTFSRSYVSAEFGSLGYFMAWELDDGVLQGMAINATSNNGWDFIRLSLSSQRLAYEMDINYLLESFSRNASRNFFMFGTFSPFIVLVCLWRPNRQKRQQKPLPESLEDQRVGYG